MKCPNCGKESSSIPSWRWCPECGHDILIEERVDRYLTGLDIDTGRYIYRFDEFGYLAWNEPIYELDKMDIYPTYVRVDI